MNDMPEHHVVLIPVEGLPEVLHSEVPIDVEAVLRVRQTEGSYVGFTITIDGERTGIVGCLIGTGEPTNDRARDALVLLTGVHMIFTGPVAFARLRPHKVLELLESLT